MARLPPNPKSLFHSSSHNCNNNMNNNNYDFHDATDVNNISDYTFEPHTEACHHQPIHPGQSSLNPISNHNQQSQSNYSNHNYPQTMQEAQQYQFQLLKEQYRPSSPSRDSSLFLDSFGNHNNRISNNNNTFDTTNNNQNVCFVSTQNVCFLNYGPPAKKRQCIRKGYNGDYVFNSGTLSSNNNKDDNGTKIDKLNNKKNGNKENNQNENEDVDEDEDDDLIIKQIEKKKLNQEQDDDDDEDLKLDQINSDKPNVNIHFGTNKVMTYSIPTNTDLWTQKMSDDMINAMIIKYNIPKNVPFHLLLMLKHIKPSMRKKKKHQSHAIFDLNDIIYIKNLNEYQLDMNNINICIITNKNELQLNLFRVRNDIISIDGNTKKKKFNCAICIRQGKKGQELRNYTRATNLNSHIIDFHLSINGKAKVKRGDNADSHRGIRWKRLDNGKIQCLKTDCGLIWDNHVKYNHNCYWTHKTYWSQK